MINTQYTRIICHMQNGKCNLSKFMMYQIIKRSGSLKTESDTLC